MKKLLVVAMSLLLVVSCSSKGGVTEDGNSKTAVKGLTGSDAGAAGDLKTIHFDFDKFSLTVEAKTILKKNAEWLKKNTKTKVQVEGHCDSMGTIEYNISLGEKRASTVKKYLVALGIKADRLSTISYGKEKPVDLADTEEARAKNRRANFVLVN